MGASGNSSPNKNRTARTSDCIDRLLLIPWLKMLRTHPLLAHIVLAVVILVVIDSVLVYIFDVEPGLPHGMGAEIVIVLTISVAIPFILTFLPLRQQIYRIVTRAAKIGPPRATDVVVRFLRGELDKVLDDLDRLKSREGLDVGTKMVPEWVQKRCWDTMKGPYIGTARHLPSRYMDILRGYLNDHEEYLKHREKRDSIRIVFREESELIQDRKEHRKGYDEFLNWHKKNKVELKLLSWKRAKALSREHKLPRSRAGQPTTDVGCWDEESILLWKYGHDPTKGKVWLRMTFAGEELYEDCRKFLSAVEQEAVWFPGYLDHNTQEDNISASREEDR